MRGQSQRRVIDHQREMGRDGGGSVAGDGLDRSVSMVSEDGDGGGEGGGDNNGETRGVGGVGGRGGGGGGKKGGRGRGGTGSSWETNGSQGETGELPIWVSEKLESPLLSIAATGKHASSAYIVAGLMDGQIVLWDAEAPNLGLVVIQQWQGHTLGVSALAFDDRGQMLSSGSLDSVVAVYHRRDLKEGGDASRRNINRYVWASVNRLFRGVNRLLKEGGGASRRNINRCVWANTSYCNTPFSTINAMYTPSLPYIFTPYVHPLYMCIPHHIYTI